MRFEAGFFEALKSTFSRIARSATGGWSPTVIYTVTDGFKDDDFTERPRSTRPGI
jgi:hypothetical protein